MDDREFDVAILGAGPAGLSAAARAAQRRLTHIVLESGARHANTIQQYQHRKHVMAEPGLLPLRSDIQFAAGRREQVLDRWADAIRQTNLHIRYDAHVTAISGEHGAFDVALKCGTNVRARNVILALGTQGNARRLGVPGDDLPCVRTTLADPQAHQGETIVVVGAGDAAIENALALAAGNRVILVNRRGDFPRAKEGNVARTQRGVARMPVQHRSLLGRAGGRRIRRSDRAAYSAGRARDRMSQRHRAPRRRRSARVRGIPRSSLRG